MLVCRHRGADGERMDSSQWRPLDPARSWRLGVRVAAGTSAVLAVSLAVGGERGALVWGLVAASLALAAAAWVITPRRLPGAELGWRLQYVWSVLGVLATAVLAAALEGGIFRYGLVLAVAAVSASGVYRPLGHDLYRLLLLVVIVLSWAVRPAGVTTAQLLLYIGLFVALLYLVGELSGELRRSLVEESRTRDAIDHRNRVLGMVGRAASLETERIFDAVVDAVVACGFDIASIGVVRDGAVHSVATRGLPEDPPPAPAAAGISGRALQEDRTVAVSDYQSHPDRLPHRPGVRAAVATPIRTERGARGMLIGARTRPGAPSADDVEMLELLALHAGHALSVVSQYEDEQQVVARLRDLDALKRDFVSNVSHELRTPLTVIKGLGRTLAARQEALEPDQVGQLLDRINANVRRLGAMLGGLLDFNRSGGQLRLDRRPVDAPALIREVVSRSAPMLERHTVELQLPPSALVDVDPALIEHVLENLLGNAAKHTPPGTQVVVEVVADHRDGVEIRVRDDGPGIAEEDIPRLTQRYYRGTGREGTVEGSGVGLALVNEILEAHGATLQVKSSDRAGTTFSFMLPGVATVLA